MRASGSPGRSSASARITGTSAGAAGKMGSGAGRGAVSGAEGAEGAGAAGLVATAVAPRAAACAAAVPAPRGVAAAPVTSSISAISTLYGTVCPSSTSIRRRIPSKGDGTSALTLSVMTSSSGSSLATLSPGCLSHFPIVPSATLSPSWGIVTLATYRSSCEVSVATGSPPPLPASLAHLA